MGIYKDVIMQAVFLFPLVAFVFTLPYIIYNYHKYGSVFSARILIVYSFILYLMCAFFLVILPLPSRAEVDAMTGPRAQLMPFNFIADIIKEAEIGYGSISLKSLIKNKAFFQVIFNVFMIVPFGMYLRYYFKCGLKKVILFSFLLSLFFELTQLSGLYFIYPRGYRLFDVDDLMVNTLGGIVGYIIVKPFLRILPTRDEMDNASIRRGKKVSLLRRVVAFCVDIFIAWIIATVIHIFLPDIDRKWVISAVIITIESLIFRGFTVGKAMVRLRVVDESGTSAKWYQHILRYGSFWAVMLLVPLLLSYIVGLVDWNFERLLLSCLLFGGWFIFLVIELVMIAIRRPVFYEKISKTCEISTIRKGN